MLRKHIPVWLVIGFDRTLVWRNRHSFVSDIEDGLSAGHQMPILQHRASKEVKRCWYLTIGLVIPLGSITAHKHQELNAFQW